MKLQNSLPLKLNIPAIPFRSNIGIVKPVITPAKDGFATNPLYDNLGSKLEIEANAKSNPKIVEMLNQYNLPVKANIEELEKLKEGHLKETRIITAKIYSSLPEDLKKQVDLTSLQEAAMLHDYGKVLIPNSITNKKGRLDNNEREIMELHSELGYELLKNKNINEKTLNLIKYHHQNMNKNGYPKMDNNFEYDLGAQILSIADKYTALREKRSYKNPLSKYETLEILAKEVNSGNVSQEVYNALIKAI